MVKRIARFIAWHNIDDLRYLGPALLAVECTLFLVIGQLQLPSSALLILFIPIMFYIYLANTIVKTDFDFNVSDLKLPSDANAFLAIASHANSRHIAIYLNQITSAFLDSLTISRRDLIDALYEARDVFPGCLVACTGNTNDCETDLIDTDFFCDLLGRFGVELSEEEISNLTDPYMSKVYKLLSGTKAGDHDREEFNPDISPPPWVHQSCNLLLFSLFIMEVKHDVGVQFIIPLMLIFGIFPSIRQILVNRNSNLVK